MFDLQSFLDLARSRRTIRKFRHGPVADDLVEKIIEAGRWAPCGANSQPWEFVIIKNRENIMKICEICVEEHLRMSQIDRSFPFQNERIIRSKYCDAQVLIIVCADTRFMDAYPLEQDRKRILDFSMGACVGNLHLAATAAGLGMSWGTSSEKVGVKIKALLGIPQWLVVKEVLSIGYPTETLVPHKRSLESMIHRERFDVKKLRTDNEIRHLLETRKTANIYSG